MTAASARVRRAATVAIAAVALVLALPMSAATHPTAEPVTIVPWHKIGGAGLGMLRSAIEYRYGAPESGSYKVPGGSLHVGYSGDRVSFVTTDSVYYRTVERIGVGTRVPLGRCFKTSTNPCERRWKGFTYRPVFGIWEKLGCYGGVPTNAWLRVERGIVTYVAVGYGGGNGDGCGKASRPSLTARLRDAVARTVKLEVARVNPDIYVYRVTGFRLPRSSRAYVFVGVGIRDKQTNEEGQGFGAVLRRNGQAWSVISSGSDQVGCGVMPIKYLAEMGLECDLT